MTEPVWCEDCNSFSNADMGGEGFCDVFKKRTWYGNSYAVDCPYFKKKKMNDGGKACEDFEEGDVE